MADPCIIMCAPNGARRTKLDHPAIPITPQELATCAEDIIAENASILHLHVRDDNARHSLDVDRYKQAIAAVKDRVGDQIIIQVTSEAAGVYDAPAQINMIKTLKPEAVSIAMRELFPHCGADDEEQAFISWLQGQGIFYQVILYGPADIDRFSAAVDRGYFGKTAPFSLIVAGGYHEPQERSFEDLRAIEDRACDINFPWAICAFGAAEMAAVKLAAEKGGHIRVGFENNMQLAGGQIATGNTDLVRFANTHISKSGRPIATVDDVRRQFMTNNASNNNFEDSKVA